MKKIDARCIIFECGLKGTRIIAASCHSCLTQYEVEVTNGHEFTDGVSCPGCRLGIVMGYKVIREGEKGTDRPNG